MIERELAYKIKTLIRKFPIVTVTGPRQSGKTTLIKNIFPRFRYVSLEDLDTRDFAQSDPRGFLKNYDKNTIFDEIQRVPDLFSYLQSAVDNNSNVKFILSGSQSFLLSDNISQTLAGRVAILILLPFSYGELTNAKYKFDNFEDLLFKGFYPRIYDKKINPPDFYPNYLQTYIERDVRLIKNISNLNDFIRFLKLCAGRVGQLLNYTSLANDTGISVNTAKSWLSVLNSSYITFTLQPFYNNFNKRIIKMPKLYFYDTGLVSSLLGIESAKQISLHYLKGNLFENFIISDLMKKRFNKGQISNLYFWRDSKGTEIDCISEIAGKIIPIEIKSGHTYTNEFFKNMNIFEKLVPQKFKQYVIYGGDNNISTSAGELVSWKNIDKFS